ncbi:MAG: lytic transglycosylase domain-containing protein [Actinobacteria bacterium]|nr:lytic transglycosylase domain-containing protein [Actinomycetota bacterium]
MDELEQLIRGSQTSPKPASQPTAQKDYSSLVTDELLDRLRKVESGKDPYAVNKQTKALGPYQFMPETVADLHRKGYKFNAFDEKESREAAKKYLTELVNKSGGDLDKALAGYGGFVTKDPSEYIAKVKGTEPGRQPETDDLEQLIRGTAKEPEAQPAQQAKKEASKPRQMIEEMQAQAKQPQGTFAEFVGEKLKGAGETGLNVLTGALAVPAGAVAGIYETLTGGKYGTKEGIEQTTPPAAGVQAPAAPPSPATNLNIPPARRAELQAQMTAKPQQMAPQDIATMQAQFEARKAGLPQAPAPATPEVPITPLPGTNEEARKLIGVGAAEVTPEKLRVQRAKELPIPIELSKDQATRDPADVRFARETAKDPVLGQALQAKYADDNLKIQKNLDHFVETSGAELTGAAPGEVGQLLVNAIGPYQKARKTAITSAYDTARAAGEMDAPIQVNRLSDFVEKNQSAAKNAPVISAVGSEIKRLAKDGEISINDLEEIRKMANVLAQDSGPNAHYGRQAIRIIDKMTDGKGGKLYQRARRLNAEYMNEFEDTPVVKNILAMKRGTTQRAVAIEDLIEKSMLKGPRSDVVQLFNTLQKAGPEGQQMINEMRGYVAQRIKDEATKGVGRDINGMPYVSTQGLNKMIVDLDRSGKLELLFGKKGAEQYRTLNEVTKDLQTVPVGITNPSGTASTMLAAMAEMGAQTAMTGVPLPVAMIGKQIYGKVQTNKKLNKIRDFVEYSKEK